MITMSQLTPGPIAINSATFVGIKVAGILGGISATFGCVLPSCVIVIILAKLYYKYRSISAMQFILSGLRPAVVAMIASAGLTIVLLAFFKNGAIPKLLSDVDFISVLIFSAALFVLRKWKIDPLYVMGATGVLGLIIYSLI